jgi:CPA2 family monovalent cation:H+ antiporter-2
MNIRHDKGMEDLVTLRAITITVVAALVGGLAFARLKQPAILGYILVGILLGPSGFAVIKSREPVALLAELGVLLLLFVIGMELSLRSFKKVWPVATLCAVIQIFVSLGLVFLACPIFVWLTGKQISTDVLILLGFVGALSSTAVVVKMLESIGEFKSEIGQFTIGVLIAQDLAVIPMILMLRNGQQSFFDIQLIGKIVVSMGLIVWLIRYLSRKQRVRLPLTTVIAGERDLTPIASLTICFGAAAITGYLGLSEPYGAFLAGLVLGNTHERAILIESTKPIQTILMMVFFLSIGMLFDVDFMYENIYVVLALLLTVTFAKTGVNILILHFLKLPWSHAFLVGVVLAQLGEFAFVLTSIASDTGVIDAYWQKRLIAVTVLSIAFSPLWMAIARKVDNLIDHNLNLKFSLKRLLKK